MFCARGVLPYINHIGVCVAPSGRVFAPFWSGNGHTPYPFWSGIGYDFQGNYKDCMNVFIISIPNELERKRKMNLKWISTICCLHSNLSNDNIISAKKLGLKTSMDFRDLV